MSTQAADSGGGDNEGSVPDLEPSASHPYDHLAGPDPDSTVAAPQPGTGDPVPGQPTQPAAASPAEPADLTIPEPETLATSQLPDEPGVVTTSPLPGEPGAVTTSTVPGEPGAASTSPLPGEPGVVTASLLPGEPGAGSTSTLPAEAGSIQLPDTPPAAPRQRRLGRVIALVSLIVVGVAGVGVGGTLLTRELTRGPTKAEKTAAVQQEIASRWQRYPGGKIFTPTLAYSSSDWGANFEATLVGIAPAASCGAALDPAMAHFLVQYGCVTVLRATYLDYSGTQAVTIGVVVMKTVGDAASAASLSSSFVPAGVGVRTFPLPGTVAAEFGDAQRRYFSPLNDFYNYVFLSVVGFTDGRISGSASSLPSLGDLGSGVISSEGAALTAPGSACAMKDIRC
jgi:hypothetical protein